MAETNTLGWTTGSGLACRSGHFFFGAQVDAILSLLFAGESVFRRDRLHMLRWVCKIMKDDLMLLSEVS